MRIFCKDKLNSLTENGHCDEQSGCEAKPKQTRSRFLRFARNKLRNLTRRVITRADLSARGNLIRLLRLSSQRLRRIATLPSVARNDKREFSVSLLSCVSKKLKYI